MRSSLRQSGTVLLLMLVIMVIGSMALLVSSLGQASLQITRDRKNSEALAQAKEALLAYAITSSLRSATCARPGNLPCPDTDAPGTTGYGDAEGSCVSSSGTSIGRLPWKTLGIPELVDADGEPLWYALSDNFRSLCPCNGAHLINSDTPGTLSVYDSNGTSLLTPTGSEAVAIVFAPGAPLSTQARSALTSEVCATRNGSNIKQNLCPANYLDSGLYNRNNAMATGPFITGNKTDTFNDRLIYLSTNNIFAANEIEKLVSKEIENGLKPLLNNYYSVWGAFPSAASFVQPTSAPATTFTGKSGTIYGLLPVGNLLPNNSIRPPLWKSVPTYSVSGRGGDSGNCTVDPGSLVMHCPCTESHCPATITVGEHDVLTISGEVTGAGLGLWNLFDKDELTQLLFQVSASPSTNRLYNDTAVRLNNLGISGNLNADGSATITLTGTRDPPQPGVTLSRIEMKGMKSPCTTQDDSCKPNYASFLSCSPLLASWLLTNNWHQHMFYALSKGYAPGTFPAASNSCVPHPGSLPLPAPPAYDCLKVNGSGNDKRAIILMMGKALAGKTHNTANLADYLEGENATPADLIYEINNRSSSFNDQVKIIAP